MGDFTSPVSIMKIRQTWRSCAGQSRFPYELMNILLYQKRVIEFKCVKSYITSIFTKITCCAVHKLLVTIFYVDKISKWFDSNVAIYQNYITTNSMPSNLPQSLRLRWWWSAVGRRRYFHPINFCAAFSTADIKAQIIATI